MAQDEYYKHLGGLLGNLQSLEFMIRVYLQKHLSIKELGIPFGESLYICTVDSELPENELTNYNSLGILIDKINKIFTQKEKMTIDRKIVCLRDLLAHGRISGFPVDDQVRIMKFTKPINGKVKVEFNEIMTEEWFTLNKKRVLDAIDLVYENY